MITAVEWECIRDWTKVRWSSDQSLAFYFRSWRRLWHLSGSPTTTRFQSAPSIQSSTAFYPRFRVGFRFASSLLRFCFGFASFSLRFRFRFASGSLQVRFVSVIRRLPAGSSWLSADSQRLSVWVGLRAWWVVDSTYRQFMNRSSYFPDG